MGNEKPENVAASASNTPNTPNTKVSLMRTNTFSTQKCVTYVSILFFINLLNYMDRLTVSAVLPDLQRYFRIGDSEGGLLQTVFVVAFMVFAPVCGFLGDRYNRKLIVVFGLLVWILAVIASSFVPREHFWAFMFLRGVVGIGEASYSTIAPTMIADIFVLTLRSRILMLFYFAIPVGSGLGFIVGSKAAEYFGNWKWSIRVTPPFGFITLLALIFFIDEPERGLAEREYFAESKTSDGALKEQKNLNGNIQVQMKDGKVKIQTNPALAAGESSYLDDLAYLLRKRSYIWLVIGYTTILFLIGTLSWWAVPAIQHFVAWDKKYTKLPDSEKAAVSMTFGVIICASGIFGVTLGTLMAQMWKAGKGCFRCCQSPNADAYVSAIGSFAAVPFLYIGLYCIDKNLRVAWCIIFLAILSLSLNWAIVVDLLMYVVVPWRRNVANSWLILISHLFGDASGPYIVGLISDFLRGNKETPEAQFKSLVASFYGAGVVLVVSGVAFLFTARNLPDDVRAFEEETGMKRETVDVEKGVQEEISERMKQKVPV